MPHRNIMLKIPERFENALKTGDLLFLPSTMAKLADLDMEFEIRICPALQHKPTLPAPQVDAGNAGIPGQGNNGKVFDPFAPPYNSNLYVDGLKDDESQEEFVVLLNKYSVVPHHFLLVTKEFRSQVLPLMPSELLHAYLFLVAGLRAGKRFISIYNCGKNSGASQGHKHIQFIPVDDHNGPPIERLARQTQLEFPDRPFSLTKLSYASHTLRFPAGMDEYPLNRLEAVLSSAFIQLLDLSISTIRHDPDYPAGSPSYNVILTLEHLHIIPRKHENYLDTVSVNAMGFAGMLLVKSEAELETVKRETVSKILRSVALQSVHDIQIEGTSQEIQTSSN